MPRSILTWLVFASFFLGISFLVVSSWFRKTKNAKKIIACVILSSLVLSLLACNNDIVDKNSYPSNKSSIELPDMNPPMPLPEYPIIDGSSSTATMHAAIRAYLTDEYFLDQHSQTYAALERLVPGNDNPADVVLAVKYYNETLEDVKRRGADLAIAPIAKEGFVFLINSDNPIDSLTQQQLRDIYSGKIKNWKEVGGKNEKIKLYTRNWASGSQTAMEEFMGGVPIIEGEDVPIFSMGTMLEVIDFGGSAVIGYNIYSWSMERWTDSGSLKLLSVDGIAPSNETLADGSYPLTVYTYSYYNKGNEKGKALTDWLLTAEGQTVLASAGYVGIFGELPSISEEFESLGFIDFNKDGANSETMVFEYYYENRQRFGLNDSNYPHQPERITDRAQTEALASGKGKDVTVLYLFHYDGTYNEANSEYDDWRSYDYKYTRFIVLTREKGGTFEIINEGEVLSYENGMITVGDN